MTDCNRRLPPGNDPVLQRRARFAIVLGLGAALCWWCGCAGPPPRPHPATAPTAPPRFDEGQNRRSVQLLFTSKDSGLLRAEGHGIFRTSSLSNQAKQVVWALIQGPQNQGGSTLPAGTRLREIYFGADGTLYVDFTRQLQTNHGGGSRGEIETVYSIVDTLALNFPEVRRVQLLIEGREFDTLAGHLDTSRPLVPDWQWVEPQSRPGGASAATG
jgi:hypothetical protein